MAKSLKLVIEALLFASDKPLTARDIHAVLPDTKLQDITSALRVLKYEYEAFGRSFGLKEVADAFQFRSHTEYGSYILTMYQSSPSRLSRAALETLAIIAYKQPVLRHEVERLRGVDSGGIIKMLLERELIRIVGRKNLPGRPLIYGTTKKFLEVFDLKDLDSLPKMKEIKALGADEPDQSSQAQLTPAQEEPPGNGEKQQQEQGSTPQEEPAIERQEQQEEPSTEQQDQQPAPDDALPVREPETE
ncbi:MAG: SMC-Scp complex subunit ScpB [Desulfobacteraceae bacterium]|nr:MAG: SMC-Scp complex subunit ScpB [Desulfobacteraceae bacterium]